MAICKQCGCAIPLGSKTCDMCAVVRAIAPAQQPLAWAASPEAVRPALPADVVKAQKRLREAWQFLGFIGAVWLVVGTIAEVGNIDGLLNYFDWYTAAEGAVFLVLAYFIRRGSLIALGIAIAVYALDTVALFVTGHIGIIRMLILIFLARSLGSANLLRRHRKAVGQQPPAMSMHSPTQARQDQRRAA